MRRRPIQDLAELPKVRRNARQKWLMLNFNRAARSLIQIGPPRWASMYPATRRACQGANAPRAAASSAATAGYRCGPKCSIEIYGIIERHCA
jgi:hypothetical protein